MIWFIQTNNSGIPCGDIGCRTGNGIMQCSPLQPISSYKVDLPFPVPTEYIIHKHDYTWIPFSAPHRERDDNRCGSQFTFVDGSEGTCMQGRSCSEQGYCHDGHNVKSSEFCGSYRQQGAGIFFIDRLIHTFRQRGSHHLKIAER